MEIAERVAQEYGKITAYKTDVTCTVCEQVIPAGSQVVEHLRWAVAGGWYPDYHYHLDCAPANIRQMADADHDQESRLAAKYGITIEQLRREQAAWVNNEGYDSHGNEYETFDAWLRHKPTTAVRPMSREPVDGGRGTGMLGVED